MINIVIGFLSGIISGMGIGGGAILIPALILFADISQKSAQGINLTYFIPTAIISLVVHIRQNRIEKKTAMIIGSFGIIGASIGSLLAISTNGRVLRVMFGLFLLLYWPLPLNGVKTPLSGELLGRWRFFIFSWG